MAHDSLSLYMITTVDQITSFNSCATDQPILGLLQPQLMLIAIFLIWATDLANYLAKLPKIESFIG